MSGEETVSILYLRKDQYEICEKNLTSGNEKDFVLTDKTFWDARVTRMISLEDDQYLLWGSSELFVVDGKGGLLNKKHCPDHLQYQNATCLPQKGGMVAVSFYSEKEKEFQIAYYNTKSGSLSKPRKVKSANVLASDGRICFYDATGIYELNDVTSESEPCVRFRDYQIYEVSDVSIGDDGFGIVTYKEDDPSILRVVMLSETELSGIPNGMESEFTEDGRRILRVYVCGGQDLGSFGGLSDELFEEFNETNERYVVAYYENDKITMETAAMLVNPPDILVDPLATRISDYARNGYLMELGSYVNQSDKLKEEDLPLNLMNGGVYDGNIYAIPRHMILQSILLPQSETAGKESWSTDEFLDWIGRQENLCCDIPLNQNSILTYVFLGNLDEYIDFKTHKANFVDSDFEAFLNKLKALKIREGNLYMPRFDMQGVLDDTDSFMGHGQINHLLQLAETRITVGEELVEMGLPNNAGKKLSVSHPIGMLGIFQGSRCKEGAYEFLEFCLLHDTKNIRHNGKSSGDYLAVSSARKKEADGAMGTHEFIAEINGQSTSFTVEVTGTDRMLYEDLWNHSFVMTQELSQMESIVLEEVAPFLNGQITADVACERIQSRIQLLLNEGK